MQFDKKQLDRLLTLNDDQLGALIQKIAVEAGIDASLLGINSQNIDRIRQALSSANEQDLEQLNDVYHAYKQNKYKN